MRFLIKSAFLLFMLFAVIAFFTPTPEHGQNGESGYSTLDAFIAVKNTISDFGNFCVRNPSTCETGKSFISSLGEKARDGARIAYEFLDRKFGDPKDKTDTTKMANPEPEDIQTGSIRNAEHQPSKHPRNGDTNIDNETNTDTVPRFQ